MNKKPLSKTSKTESQRIQTLDQIKRVEKQTAVVNFRTYPSIKNFLETLAANKGLSLSRFLAWQTEEAYRLVTETKP